MCISLCDITHYISALSRKNVNDSNLKIHEIKKNSLCDKCIYIQTSVLKKVCSIEWFYLCLQANFLVNIQLNFIECLIEIGF